MFSAVWFGICYAGLTALTLMMLYSLIRNPQTRAVPAAFIWPMTVMGGMFVLVACVEALGRWLARDEAAFLLHFLAESFEAQEVPPA